MTGSDKRKVVETYLIEIQAVLNSGDAREHAYRPAFKKLIESLRPEINAINEPAYTGGNAPDFLFKKGETPIAYAECKDVTVDIDSKDVQKQAMRYVEAFGRILLTNYYDFQITTEGGDVINVSIAEKEGNQIIAKEEELEKFANLIYDYMTPSYRTIKSARKLAEIMASKGRILRDNALASLSQNQESDIYAQYVAFKEVLIHELKEEEFADMYAQTLVYGLFVARYFDDTLENFSRHEAHDLLPSTNPLLKKFFGHVAGTDYDPKIAWLVDSLIEAYKGANVHEIMHKEFKSKQKDPVLHFYETFLAKYDEGLRKSRGVYYTPEPVVSFIVRSVDQILKSKFNLSKGLADTSKIDHKFKVQGEDARRKDGVKRNTDKIHKVQILDPAVGTGTFLNEVIGEIYDSFKGQEGMWSSYVREHLLPRLHGFELMMASYTMAHLNLGVTLKELGYDGDNRLSVWLTNSLEESVHEVPNLFMSQWLTEESQEASRLKFELPIMVVLGNPPYSVSSANKGEDIQNLIKDYKKNLNERNIQPLSDDYIKFIRFAENQIEKTDYGIVAMITNNSFLDGVNHRQMRKHLMETFDEIYVLDLHGNAKKKEVAPDGGKDENVFSIMQGVSINLFVKTGEGKGLAKVYHSELFGKQKDKYKSLDKSSFESVKWKKLKVIEPYYFFVPKDFGAEELYNKGFGVNEALMVSGPGVETGFDVLFVSISRNDLLEKFNSISNKDNEELIKMGIENKKSFKIKDKLLKEDLNNVPIYKYSYKAFDQRNIAYYENSLRRADFNVFRNAVGNKENVFLALMRSSVDTYDFKSLFVTNGILDKNFYSFQTYAFPLYLYHEDDTRTPNLNQEIWQKIDKIVGKTEPEDIFDYIYVVLHSPSYREKYKEFLKIDFPRVPYPKDKKVFWKLVELGKELRELHLLGSPKVNKFITTFPVSGENMVESKYPKYKDGNVYINETQYFGKVPEVAWDFYIGGYQPAQKWLKDRRGRELPVEDIEHYQKMIVALSETDRVMLKIDDYISL